MEIRLSTMDELFACEGGLFAEHWHEVAGFKQLMVLKPDEERYRTMDARGQLVVLAAFEGQAIVGYSITFIANHLHYADLCTAVNDVLFLAPAMRRASHGKQLIAATEAHAKERGAKILFWHAKPDTALDTLLPRLDYSMHERIHAKEL